MSKPLRKLTATWLPLEEHGRVQRLAKMRDWSVSKTVAFLIKLGLKAWKEDTKA